MSDTHDLKEEEFVLTHGQWGQSMAGWLQGRNSVAEEHGREKMFNGG